jgi:hypothetical protein
MQPAGYQPAVFNQQSFKIYGAILSLLAAATLALGIANVVMTKEAYCEPWEEAGPVWCSNTKEPYIWTWVASGIWASVPIFLAGLTAMCLSGNPAAWTRVFALLIFLSAIVFSPAMIVLSAIEVWRGHASEYSFYKLSDSLMEGTIMVEDSPYQAKFALPLVIAILGGIIFIMTGIITLTLCCCMESIGIYMPQELDASVPVQRVFTPPPAAPVVQRQIYYQPRPQVKNQFAIDYQPTTGAYMATRYNSVPDPYGSGGVFYGNFPSRAGGFMKSGGGSSDFFNPQPASFWQ